jgi:hypothetical protein
MTDTRELMTENADEYRLTLSGVDVAVIADPIEVAVQRGGFDALVSSDDTQLSMAGGVSRAILAACMACTNSFASSLNEGPE